MAKSLVVQRSVCASFLQSNCLIAKHLSKKIPWNGQTLLEFDLWEPLQARLARRSLSGVSMEDDSLAVDKDE